MFYDAKTFVASGAIPVRVQTSSNKKIVSFNTFRYGSSGVAEIDVLHITMLPHAAKGLQKVCPAPLRNAGCRGNDFARISKKVAVQHLGPRWERTTDDIATFRRTCLSLCSYAVLKMGGRSVYSSFSPSAAHFKIRQMLLYLLCATRVEY